MISFNGIAFGVQAKLLTPIQAVIGPEFLDRSTGKEVEHIAQFRRRGPINLGKRTMVTGHCGKAFVLNIEDLGKCTPGSPKLIGIEFFMTAFRALPVLVFHSSTLD